MDNVIISVNQDTRYVEVAPRTIAVSGENLQGQFIVEFSEGFIDGKARIDVFICSSGKKGYIELTKKEKTYVCDISKSITEKAGKIKMQLVVEQNAIDGKTPIYKSSIFDVMVEESINAENKLED